MVLPSPASPAHFDPTLSWENFRHYNCLWLKGPLQLAPTNSFLKDGKYAWSHTIPQARNVVVFSLMHSHTVCSSAQTIVFQQTGAGISWCKLPLHTQCLSVFSPSFWMFSSTIRKGEIPVCCFKLSHTAVSLCYQEGKLLSRVDSSAWLYMLEECKKGRVQKRGYKIRNFY